MKKAQDLNRYGFSDIRMWPGYMAFSGLALVLMPAIGSLMAITILVALTVPIATYANKRDTVTYQEIDESIDNYIKFIESLDSYSFRKTPHANVGKKKIETSPVPSPGFVLT